MMFWLGLILGWLVGIAATVFVLSLCRAAAGPAGGRARMRR
jgi:hypothetical protein